VPGAAPAIEAEPIGDKGGNDGIEGIMKRSEENRAINEVIDRLARQFPAVPNDEVALAVQETRPEFDDAPIREYVPLFVERSAKNRLRSRVSSHR
jgi:hypothetical protein